jgi:hypothetical protein
VPKIVGTHAVRDMETWLKGRIVEPEPIEWTTPARPLLEPAALLWRPRTDSNRRRRP